MDAIVAGVTIETNEADQGSETLCTRFDQEMASPSMAVIGSLAEVMDARPLDLNPLQTTVDTDALDAIVRGRSGTEGDIPVAFTHSGHDVTESSDGAITVSPEHEPTARREA